MKSSLRAEQGFNVSIAEVEVMNYKMPEYNFADVGNLRKAVSLQHWVKKYFRSSDLSSELKNVKSIFKIQNKIMGEKN